MKAKRNPEADAEILAFEDALLLSIDQAKRGEGRVNTPEQIKALKESVDRNGGTQARAIARRRPTKKFVTG